MHSDSNSESRFHGKSILLGASYYCGAILVRTRMEVEYIFSIIRQIAVVRLLFLLLLVLLHKADLIEVTSANHLCISQIA